MLQWFPVLARSNHDPILFVHNILCVGSSRQVRGRAYAALEYLDREEWSTALLKKYNKLNCEY